MGDSLTELSVGQSNKQQGQYISNAKQACYNSLEQKWNMDLKQITKPDSNHCYIIIFIKTSVVESHAHILLLKILKKSSPICISFE